MKDKCWCDRTKKLQSTGDTNNAKKFFNKLKTVNEPSSKDCSPIVDLDGNTVIKELTLLTSRWAQYFDQLHNR